MSDQIEKNSLEKVMISNISKETIFNKRQGGGGKRQRPQV